MHVVTVTVTVGACALGVPAVAFAQEGGLHAPAFSQEGGLHAPAFAQEGGLRAPAWTRDAQGRTFRTSFDLGDRLVLSAAVSWQGAAAANAGAAPGAGGARAGDAPGAGAGTGAGAGAGAGTGALPAFEIALFRRAEAPRGDPDVFWKRDHEALHVVADGASGQTRLAGVAYRGLFLRHAKQGTLTVPTSPPWSVPLPFDVGLAAEAGRFSNVRAPWSAGGAADFGIVGAEVLLDVLRSPRAGRFLALGVGGRYDLSLDRAAAVTLDQRITPMTGVSLAGRYESRRGLFVAAARVETQRRWSSLRGWEQAHAAQADLEAVPLAVNDVPLSLFISARVEAAGGLPEPRLAILSGLRVGVPWR